MNETKKKVFVLLTQQYADWEIGFVLPELNREESPYEVYTIGLDNNPVVAMSGLKVTPDFTLDNYPNDFAMLIVAGGMSWQSMESSKISDTIKFCRANNIIVAAICDAVTYLAKKSFLDEEKHTGNTLEYLKMFAPTYKGEINYLDKPSVVSKSFITANGLAALEFSKDILEVLSVMDEDKLNIWYSEFKTGIFNIESYK